MWSVCIANIAIHMLLLTVAVFESGITEYSNFSVFSMIISVLNEHVFTDQKNKKRKSIVWVTCYREICK